MTDTTPGDEKGLSDFNAAFESIETVGALKEIIDQIISHRNNTDAINAIQNPSLRSLVTNVYGTAHEAMTSRIIQGHDAEIALMGFAATIRNLSDTYKIDFSPEGTPSATTKPLDQESHDTPRDLKKFVGYDHIINKLEGITDSGLLTLSDIAMEGEMNTLASKIKSGISAESALQDFNTAMRKLSDIVGIKLLPPSNDGNPSSTISDLDLTQ